MSGRREKPVLLIDDDDDARALVREALEGVGYEVVEASDGKQALELLVSERAAEPCVMIVDLAMPIMTGWELISIVSSYIRLAQIPVMVVSSSPPREKDSHGVPAAWLQKPVKANEVVERVNLLTRRNRAA